MFGVLVHEPAAMLPSNWTKGGLHLFPTICSKFSCSICALRAGVDSDWARVGRGQYTMRAPFRLSPPRQKSVLSFGMSVINRYNLFLGSFSHQPNFNR